MEKKTIKTEYLLLYVDLTVQMPKFVLSSSFECLLMLNGFMLVILNT